LTDTNVQCIVQQLVMINMRCLAMEEKIGMVVKILISVHQPNNHQDLMVMIALGSVQLNVMVMICIVLVDKMPMAVKCQQLVCHQREVL